MRLAGKVAVVTGVGPGIKAAFASEGAVVCVPDIAPPTRNLPARHCARDDAGPPEDGGRYVRLVVSNADGPDVLVNNSDAGEPHRPGARHLFVRARHAHRGKGSISGGRRTLHLIPSTIARSRTEPT